MHEKNHPFSPTADFCVYHCLFLLCFTPDIPVFLQLFVVLAGLRKMENQMWSPKGSF